MRFQASFHIIIFLACLIPSAVAGGHIDSSMYSITGYFDSYRCSTHFKQLWPLEVYQLWGGIPIDISNIDSVNAYYIIKKVESEFRCAGMCSRRTYLYYQPGIQAPTYCYTAVRNKVKSLLVLILVPGIIYAVANLIFVFTSCCCIDWLSGDKNKPVIGATFTQYKTLSATGQPISYLQYQAYIQM